MGSTPPVRVLHVIESYGSGSLTAAAQYVRSTPDLEHHLLRRIREDYVPFGEEVLFTSVTDLPRSRVRSIGAVRKATRTLSPEVVHAHSSFAGLFARLALRAGRPARVVYTPHCFVFERTDISATARRGYRLVEWALAINTTVIAGCSTGEVRAAQAWRTCRRAVHVPNIVRDAPVAERARHAERPVVVSLGRVSAQKDADFFLATLRDLGQRGRRVRGLWIGGGDSADVARLEAAGVEVTGWVTRDRVLDLLSSADLYLHTAAWEGFPMSILEAHRMGLPILVRDIAAFHHLPAALRGRSPRELATLAEDMLLAPSHARADRNRSLWDAALIEHSPEIQRDRLLEAYGVA
ncbi:glycosyltransferase [Nocardioides carbamazepini]|jgi:glycosyltransferase involved in cell wall biosynthesis|uniref:glycosyltransferase n=1 Tax=Nocardioides carbamazepini TaxID=2854259 RepID=UPI002149BCDF|nr:glycosyltransferase [Nocardioides carbamazepini]MCR1781696.1 glycosyltransferase [Nocardioides carbamazepini]